MSTTTKPLDAHSQPNTLADVIAVETGKAIGETAQEEGEELDYFVIIEHENDVAIATNLAPADRVSLLEKLLVQLKANIQ